MNRREFLKVTGAAAGVVWCGSYAVIGGSKGLPGDFSFFYIGDLHFDKPEHHDMAWVRAHKPTSVRQIEIYCRVTSDVHPVMFRKMADLARHHKPALGFVVQAGDLVQGLCGSRTLAERQMKELFEFARADGPNLPWLITKGNHDITGPGAREAYESVVLPYLEKRNGSQLSRSCFSYERGNSSFAFFDGYDADRSLDWLEKTLSASKARFKFVVVHEPVVPFTARSSWIVFGKPGQESKRERLVNLLGSHSAIVLTGHLHKYGIVTRRTPSGWFSQVGLCSVVPRIGQKRPDVLQGVENYGPDLVDLEPRFSPNTAEERRAVLVREKPFIEYFEYGNLPGFGIVTVGNTRVMMDVYSGAAPAGPWRTVELSLEHPTVTARQGSKQCPGPNRTPPATCSAE